MNLILKVPGLSMKRPLTPLPVGAAPGTLAVDPDAPTPQLHVMAYGPDDTVEQKIFTAQHAGVELVLGLSRLLARPVDHRDGAVVTLQTQGLDLVRWSL